MALHAEDPCLACRQVNEIGWPKSCGTPTLQSCRLARPFNRPDDELPGKPAGLEKSRRIRVSWPIFFTCRQAGAGVEEHGESSQRCNHRPLVEWEERTMALHAEDPCLACRQVNEIGWLKSFGTPSLQLCRLARPFNYDTPRR